MCDPYSVCVMPLRVKSWLLFASLVLGLFGPIGVLGARLHDLYVGAQDMLCAQGLEAKYGPEMDKQRPHADECHLREVRKIGFASSRAWDSGVGLTGILLAPIGEGFRPAEAGDTVADQWFREGMAVALVLAAQGLVSGVALVLRDRRRARSAG